MRDVYEYENGQPRLLSSGTSDSDSMFFDATPSGSDVFFATSEQLVPQDTDTAADLTRTRQRWVPAICSPSRMVAEASRLRCRRLHRLQPWRP